MVVAASEGLVAVIAVRLVPVVPAEVVVELPELVDDEAVVVAAEHVVVVVAVEQPSKSTPKSLYKCL